MRRPPPLLSHAQARVRFRFEVAPATVLSPPPTSVSNISISLQRPLRRKFFPAACTAVNVIAHNSARSGYFSQKKNFESRAGKKIIWVHRSFPALLLAAAFSPADDGDRADPPFGIHICESVALPLLVLLHFTPPPPPPRSLQAAFPPSLPVTASSLLQWRLKRQSILVFSSSYTTTRISTQAGGRMDGVEEGERCSQID